MSAINNVVESIEAGRRNKTTATNPELIVAEEEVSAALYKLEQGRARIGAVEGEARVVEQYRDIVEEGRQQFNKEMASIMPDVKLGRNRKCSIILINDKVIPLRSHCISGSCKWIVLKPKKWSLKELKWVSRAASTTDYDDVSLFQKRIKYFVKKRLNVC